MTGRQVKHVTEASQRKWGENAERVVVVGWGCVNPRQQKLHKHTIQPRGRNRTPRTEASSTVQHETHD